jgi:hypothetical protein
VGDPLSCLEQWIRYRDGDLHRPKYN